MVWFSKGKKNVDMLLLEKEIIDGPVPFSKDLKEQLKQIDFEQSWQLTKKVAPLLGKKKARSLVRLLYTNDTTDIIALLEEREEIECAIECLGYLASREAVEALVKLLNHKYDTIQIMAAGALKNHTPRLVVPYLIEMLLSGQVLPSRAGEVLLEMDYLAQDALLGVYDQAASRVKAQILELLTVSRNPKCRPFLNEALLSEEMDLKKAALQAVSAFMYNDLWLEVAVCLTDSAWQIRTKAMDVLAKLNVKEALELVRPFINDEDAWVREGAKKCIDLLENNDVEKFLEN